LRWNDFESNISGAFKELREDKDFFDVTLACDDDQLQAHKVILSACSPFFRTILRRNRHEHPLLYLKGVKYVDLVSVLNFMYHGEVNVAQEELNSFLAVAEDLKVKGLTQNHSETQKGTHIRQTIHSKPRTMESQQVPNLVAPAKQLLPKATPQLTRPIPATYQQEDDDIQEVVPIKSEPIPTPAEPTPTSYTNTDMVEQQGYSNNDQQQEGIMAEYGEEYADYEGYEGMESGFDNNGVGVAGQEGNKELDDLIAKSMSLITDESGSRVWNCNFCNRTNRDKYNTRIHVETHFPGFQHQCPHCDKQAPSREALRKHISRNHKTF